MQKCQSETLKTRTCVWETHMHPARCFHEQCLHLLNIYSPWKEAFKKVEAIVNN